MSDQGSLFGPQPGGVHRDDPETSRTAATNPANMLRWGTQRYNLLLVFQGRTDGLTPDVAGQRAGVFGYSQRRRCSELENDGLLEPTGEVEDGCRLLRITDAGTRALRGVRRPGGLDYSGVPMKDAK